MLIGIEPKLVVKKSNSNPSDWDCFAGKCNASYRCLYRANIFYSIASISFYIKRIDIFLSIGSEVKKIGQCAVLVGSTVRTFSDQIQLLPDYSHLWKDALVAVLNSLGPGKYVYGSEWSTEVARDRELQGITGLTIKKVRPFFLEVVEFQSWPDWDSYWHSISANARRNYNKVKKGLESSEIIISDEAYRIKDTLDVMSIKRTMIEKKRLSNMVSLTLMRHAFRYALLKKNIRSVVCRKGLAILGFATCVDVGKHIFYLEGGAQHSVAGVGWYTLLNAIHEAFDRTGGTGAFVMGPVEEETLAKAGWSGLARSRESCRATKRQQVTVTFQWARMPDGRLS